jgi:hypothetical protein
MRSPEVAAALAASRQDGRERRKESRETKALRYLYAINDIGRIS